jgi:UDP-N-acetylmuramate dehydrogenase
MDDKMIDELKTRIRGKVLLNEKLARHTTFKIGGPADLWVEPADVKELRAIFLFAKANNIPFFLIGGGSNLLVNDTGLHGIVVHLGSADFKKVVVKGASITVGAGYGIAALVRLCCQEGLTGMESMVGIPGTVGGAIYMNAGGSANPIFKNIGEHVASVKVMDNTGSVKTLKKDQIEFGYRKSSLETYIILQVTFKLAKEDKSILSSSCAKFLNMKKQKQALDVPSAGCVFKNPEGFQFTCGQMIDMLGLKGKRIGGAEISVKHGNFIVNSKDATAADVKNLIDFVKAKVRENYNIDLELEIKVI